MDQRGFETHTRQQPARQCRQRHAKHHGHENRTHAVHQLLHRRTRRLRRRHQLRHTRECGIAAHRLRLDHEPPIQSHGAS